MNEQPLTLLKQREIEARIVGPLFRAFAKEIGEPRAREILLGVIRDLARQSGCSAAGQGNGLTEFVQVTARWREGDALTMEVIAQNEKRFDFNVTRCRFAEMYRALGLEDLGGILSCARDAAMIEGFNPEIELTRTQTLMEGASHCDFRYRVAEE